MSVAAPFLWASAHASASAPTAVDFERPLSGVERVVAKGGHSGEGPVTHRSAVVGAPRSFEAVGLAGETRPLEVRARQAGEDWTDWAEIGGGDPLYVVGGADEAQLRARGWRPRGSLHFVDVSRAGGGEPSAARRGQDEAPRPEFIGRERWGASECPPRDEPSTGVTKAVAVHHTVTSNDYTRGEAKGIVLAICRYHRNGNGWDDIGYNALVDRFGRLYEGRGGGVRRSVVGAHTEGYNAQTSGIASLGDHTSVGVNDKTRRTIASFVAWKLSVNDHRANEATTLVSRGGETNRYPRGERVDVSRVIGHRRVGITACPGDRLDAELEKIRRMAQRMQRRN